MVVVANAEMQHVAAHSVTRRERDARGATASGEFPLRGATAGGAGGWRVPITVF